jgi:hypothetical protein
MRSTTASHQLISSEHLHRCSPAHQPIRSQQQTRKRTALHRTRHRRACRAAVRRMTVMHGCASSTPQAREIIPLACILRNALYTGRIHQKLHPLLESPKAAHQLIRSEHLQACSPAHQLTAAAGRACCMQPLLHVIMLHPFVRFKLRLRKWQRCRQARVHRARAALQGGLQHRVHSAVHQHAAEVAV